MLRATFPSPGPKCRRRPCAAVGLSLLLLALAAACGKRESAPQTSTATPAFAIRGEVRLADDTPMLGTTVFCAGTSYMAFTDAEGRYAISNVPPGIHTVVARREGFDTLELGRVELPERPAPGIKGITLASATLARAKPDEASAAPTAPLSAEPIATSHPATTGTLTGTLRLAGGGRADLALLHLDGVLAATPDAAGRFVFAGLAAGVHTLRIECDGYAATERLANVPAGRTIDLAAIELAQTEPQADEKPAIVGSVLAFGADGTARELPANVSVRIVENGHTATVASDGAFSFDDLGPGHYTLAAQAPGFVARKREPVDLKNTSVVVVLAIEEAKGTLTGIVVLKNPAKRDRPEGSQAALTGTDRNSVTGADGRFSITELAPGAYTLLCTRPGYRSAEVRNVQVPPGGKVDVGTVTLVRDVEAPRLTGTNPADGAQDVTIVPTNVVTLAFSRHMDMATLRTGLRIDPACEFTIERPGGVPPDSASATDIVEIRIRNAPSAKPLAFKTRYNVALDDTVTDSDGTPLEGSRAFSFRTGSLTVLRTHPANGERNVATQTGQEVTFYFNGVVDPATLDTRSLDVTPPPTSLAPSAEMRPDPVTGWTVYRMHMTWRYATSYDVRLSGSIRSIDGAALSPSPYRFGFRTEEEPRLPGQ